MQRLEGQAIKEAAQSGKLSLKGGRGYENQCRGHRKQNDEQEEGEEEEGRELQAWLADDVRRRAEIR